MVMVVVNSTVYGGAGGAVATFSLAPAANEVALHEMGHTAFGLADEYEYFLGCGVDTDRNSHPAVEPIEPNVTIDSNRNTIKWRDLIAATTPMPTTANADCTRCDPQPSPVGAGVVGAFEGAHYFHCAAFRPEFNCRMRALSNPFCAVCTRRIRQVLQPYRQQTVSDIVGFGSAGVYVALSNGAGNFDGIRRVIDNFAYVAGGWRVEKHPRFLADITGDGRADIVGFGDAGVWTALSNGDGTFADPQFVLGRLRLTSRRLARRQAPALPGRHHRRRHAPTSSASATPACGRRSATATARSSRRSSCSPDFGYEAGGWRVDKHPRFLADITGDGTRRHRRLRRRRRVDGAQQRRRHVPAAAVRCSTDFGFDAGGWRVDKHPRFLADITGDGRADIVGFGDAGVWTSLEQRRRHRSSRRSSCSQTSATTPAAGGSRSTRASWPTSPATARADIVGFGDAGVWTALSNGDGTFQPPQFVLDDFGYDAGGWRVEKHPRFLADITGDGRADIVGFGDAGVYVALSNGDGTFQPPQRVVDNFAYDAGGWRVEKHPRFLADLTAPPVIL